MIKISKHQLILVLIVAWLLIQTAVPFFRKFNLAPFQYRYATFSWAMYSKPALHYEVSLFRKNKHGQKEPIPNIERFVYGYQSLQSMPQREYYQTAAEIKDRFIRLVNYITAQEDPKFQYGVSIRWIKSFDLNEPLDWEYSVDGIKFQ